MTQSLKVRTNVLLLSVLLSFSEKSEHLIALQIWIELWNWTFSSTFVYQETGTKMDSGWYHAMIRWSSLIIIGHWGNWRQGLSNFLNRWGETPSAHAFYLDNSSVVHGFPRTKTDTQRKRISVKLIPICWPFVVLETGFLHTSLGETT